MKKFSEDHGGVAIILIVIAVLLLIVGSVKGLDETTGKVNGSGVASIVGNAYSNAIDKFKDSFDNVLSGTGDGDNSNPTSGPNGEPLVSKTESQVGKYADIDGDGTVDGIIFADLMIGGSGTTFDVYGSTYTIPKIDSCKDYYIKQDSFPGILNGEQEVLSSIGNGNDRFYVMALTNIDSNEYTWYAGATNGVNDYKEVANQEFGSGQKNTSAMIQRWNSLTYGKQNQDENHKDVWNVIQKKEKDGWFLPSSKEWVVFKKNLGFGSFSDRWDGGFRGLNQYYLTSSLKNSSQILMYNFNYGYATLNNTDYSASLKAYCNVRLAATF